MCHRVTSDITAKNVAILGPDGGFRKTENYQKALKWPREPKYKIFSKLDGTQ